MSVLELELPEGLLTCERWLRSVEGRRHVGPGSWQGQAVAVKWFIDPRRAERHLARELEGGQALRAAGLPAPELLLSTMHQGQGVLATRWLESTGTPSMAQAVAALAHLHRAGLVQNDPHLGNFLLAAEGEGAEEPAAGATPEA